jgi:hypothetical protein
VPSVHRGSRCICPRAGVHSRPLPMGPQPWLPALGPRACGATRRRRQFVENARLLTPPCRPVALRHHRQHLASCSHADLPRHGCHRSDSVTPPHSWRTTFGNIFVEAMRPLSACNIDRQRFSLATCVSTLLQSQRADCAQAASVSFSTPGNKPCFAGSDGLAAEAICSSSIRASARRA